MFDLNLISTLAENLCTTSHFFLFAVHLQQAKATRDEPIFVAPAEKLRYFLSS